MNKYLLAGVGLVSYFYFKNKDEEEGEFGVTANPACPRATQDLALNTRNRNAAIKAPYIQYGPMNLFDQKYWKRMALFWNTSVGVAKKSRCSNCVAFDISPRMDACMPGPVSDADGRLGYCWMHNFKCHSARSCRTWAAGGPIKTNKVSYEWQRRKEG